MGVSPDLLRRYEARRQPRAPFPLRPGFEVRVYTRVKEGEKERTQIFGGLVTAITGSGLGKTFTVRHVVAGIGVERIFPLFSPLVTQVDILRATKVRRARLTYLRKAGAQKRRKEDASLMRKVETERAAQQRAKEEAERKVREERALAEQAAQKAAAETESTEGAREKIPDSEKTPPHKE